MSAALLYTAKRITPREALTPIVRIRCGRTYGDFRVDTNGQGGYALRCVRGNDAPGPDFDSIAVRTMGFQTLTDGFARTVRLERP